MKYLFLFPVLLLLVACGSPTEGATKATSVEVRYARHFRLGQKDGYAVLEILQPESGKVEYAYALVRRENTSKVPAGMDRIEVPVRNIAALSTTHIGMLSVIGELDCIKGSTDPAFVSNETIRKRLLSGRIAAFPDEASITPGRLLAKEISLVMYSGFGKEFPNGGKLRKLGILTMPNYDWREEHPLGKAEWIKVFGYLTGQEKKATAYFKEVEKRYNELKAELADTRQKPVVLVGSLIGDVWYAPAGESYMATILHDAGTDYLYKNEKGTGSCEHTLEQVFKNQQKATIWINPGAVSLTDLEQQQPKYALFAAFRSGNVYCYTHNSNYFWEMSAVNPHWTLEDFASIAGTRSVKALHFYQKLSR